MDKPLTERIDACGGLVDMAAFEAAEGYATARRAVTEMTPQEIQEIVKEDRNGHVAPA